MSYIHCQKQGTLNRQVQSQYQHFAIFGLYTRFQIVGHLVLF
jgi:hypothetical protein